MVGMMRYREITTLCQIPDEYPYVSILGIHPSVWSQLWEFVWTSPDRFCLLARVKPKVDDWHIYVGCASETARRQLDATWR